ncbi:unnamed protein product, partial [Ectocarpus sp. 8 AP-2014]
RPAAARPELGVTLGAALGVAALGGVAARASRGTAGGRSFVRAVSLAAAVPRRLLAGAAGRLLVCVAAAVLTPSAGGRGAVVVPAAVVVGVPAATLRPGVAALRPTAGAGLAVRVVALPLL